MKLPTVTDSLMVRVLAVLLLAAVAWGVAGNARVAVLRADLADCQRVHAEALAITLRAAREADADYRARESRITTQQTEALNAAHAETATHRADAVRLRSLLERLRKQPAAPGGGEPSAHSAAGSASAAAAEPADLPPDLLWRLGNAAGELASAADEARTAGLACQRSYQALIDAQPVRLGPVP